MPRPSIDRLYWDVPYHLVPDGKTGIEAFAVIREAMNQKRMVALGRLVMSTRERICAIEVEEQGLLLTTLRTAEEVRDVSELASPELPRPDPRMLDIAGKIIEQQAGDFDPSEFRDRYEDALRGVIEQKMKGRPVKPSADTGHESKVVDLMAALRASLGDCAAQAEGGQPQRPYGQSHRQILEAERSMNAQPQWPSFGRSTKTANRHAPPYERLAELDADLREAKARLRQVLEAVADKYDISAKDVSYAIDGYADDMLSDLVFGIQRDLEHAAEAEAPLRPLSP